MREQFAERLAARQARCDGVGKGDAGQKRESRLNGVVQRAADPGGVCLVERQEAPKWVAGKSFGNAREFQHLRHHEEHDEATVCVDGEIALGLLHGGTARMLPT